jgi:pimeloyl-ACP methyl ester carboxylesterase
MAESLQLQIYGQPEQPTLIYLPGTHGDWTLIPSFRTALNSRVRFVVVTYPRTLDWSVEDYAMGVEAELTAQGITGGWLLGESFGSQVVWPMVARGKFHAQGVILAGGFARHPFPWAARFADWICAVIPLWMLKWGMFGYAKAARFRYRNSPETRAGIAEFLARRTDLDRRAACHRLRLVAENDPRALARAVKVSIYALTGAMDPIVPWPWARRWLKRNCPALREYRVVWGADHNVLSTAAKTSADQVVTWMGES